MISRINVYTCEDCGGETVTVERDNGVDRGTTPFMLRCRANGEEPTRKSCKGMARSSMYRPRPGHPPPAWLWYRPPPEELERAEPGMKSHAAAGGLFLKPLGHTFFCGLSDPKHKGPCTYENSGFQARCLNDRRTQHGGR